MSNEFVIAIRNKIRKNIESDILKVLTAIRDITYRLNTLQEELLTSLLEEARQTGENPEEEINMLLGYIGHINAVKKEVKESITAYTAIIESNPFENTEVAKEYEDRRVKELNIH